MSARFDKRVIESDEVVFRNPFVPADIVLKNNSAQHKLSFDSEVKLLSVNLGDWKIDDNGTALNFTLDGVLKMKLE
jgi:hypothetical protein